VTFDQWKKKLMGLFKKQLFLIPGNDWLYRQWELGRPVEQVETHIRAKRFLGEQP
jgi:hypothetical protein